MGKFEPPTISRLLTAGGRGDRDAMREIVARYEDGRGDEKSEKEAFMWLELSRQAEDEMRRRSEGGNP